MSDDLSTLDAVEWGEHRNRIVAMGFIDPAVLLAHPSNPRVHPVTQQREMSAVLRTLGWLMPVVLNRRTGHLLDGHMRVPDAVAAGVTAVPVVVVDIAEEEEPLALSTINPIAEGAGLDRELAAALIERARAVATDPAIVDLLRRTMERHHLASAAEVEEPEQRDGPLVVEEADAGLYSVSRQYTHSLIVGDSTRPDTWASSLAATPPALICTDPPYGVDYIAVKDGIQRAGFEDLSERYEHIKNDDINPHDLVRDVLRCLATHSRGPLPAYVWSPPLELQMAFLSAMTEAGFVVHRQIIWRKNRFVITRSGQWHWQHEVCWYGWLKGSVPRWNFERNMTTVWDADTPSNRIHPTQKPIELFTRPIEAHTLPGDCVVDPFAGSCAIIHAAEATGRRAVACEINPTVAATALEDLRQNGFTITRQ